MVTIEKNILYPWFVSIKKFNKTYPEIHTGVFYTSTFRGWDAFTGDPVMFISEKQRWYPSILFERREETPN